MTGEIDPSQIFVAKATRVADASMRRARAPKTRQELLDASAVFRLRLRKSKDRILKALGFSVAGISYWLMTEYALDEDEAKLLATAMVELIQRNTL